MRVSKNDTSPTVRQGLSVNYGERRVKTSMKASMEQRKSASEPSHNASQRYEGLPQIPNLPHASIVLWFLLSGISNGQPTRISNGQLCYLMRGMKDRTLKWHLTKLRRAGYIESRGRRHREIRITTPIGSPFLMGNPVALCPEPAQSMEVSFMGEVAFQSAENQLEKAKNAGLSCVTNTLVLQSVGSEYLRSKYEDYSYSYVLINAGYGAKKRTILHDSLQAKRNDMKSRVVNELSIDEIDSAMPVTPEKRAKSVKKELLPYMKEIRPVLIDLWWRYHELAAGFKPSWTGNEKEPRAMNLLMGNIARYMESSSMDDYGSLERVSILGEDVVLKNPLYGDAANMTRIFCDILLAASKDRFFSKQFELTVLNGKFASLITLSNGTRQTWKVKRQKSAAGGAPFDQWGGPFEAPC